MRTIKELLILLRENLPNIIPGEAMGLCAATLYLYTDDNISWDEMILIDDFLEIRKPYTRSLYSFWWPKGELAPRLEFLDKLIAEL